MGAKVGKGSFIGYEVWMDFNNANLIELEDGAHIANRCLLLCHKRDLKNYHVGVESPKLPYVKGKILLKSKDSKEFTAYSALFSMFSTNGCNTL